MLSDERGTITVMLALAAPVLLGTLALAVEVPQAMVARQRAQLCADTAALRGAVALVQGEDPGGPARAMSSANGCPDAEVAAGGSQVTVTVRASAMGIAVSARAVARSTPSVAIIE